MIKERYVSPELAELLRKKGFNVPCKTYYYKCSNDELLFSHSERIADFNTGTYRMLSAPSLYMTMEWLRKKGVYMYVEPFITISSEGYNLEGFKPWITTFKTNWFNPLSKIGTATYSKTYEAAIEAAILYSLENLI